MTKVDRLTKDEIIDSLRLIRIIANFPNTIYIVGYDKSYITSAIKNKLTDYKPEKYLDKVFNVEFKIPEISASIINERLRNHISQLAELLARNSKISSKQKDKIYLFFERDAYHKIDHFIENERDISRFSNNLLMKFLSIKGDVDFSDFFYLELINYKYPEIYVEIYKSKERLVS